jgi:putative nucleotidyltransferase with HDIG domain
MKLVNSAFFGSRQPIVSADRAVAYLGLDTLGALVLGHSVFDTQCPVSDVSGVNMKQLWLHSIGTATVARQIAIAEKWPAQKIEEAYLAGVLHDVGKIVFATQIAPLPGSRATAGPDLTMETHHAEVGAYLLSLWGFPTSIVEAVAFHHNPGSVDVDRLGLPGLIHIANHMANALDGRGPPDCVLDEEFIERFGLSDHLARWAIIASATLGKPVNQ